jgi:luciferase-like monooxygenase
VVLVNQYASKYPYSSGEFPAPPNIPIGDPFTVLAYAAACTTTIRLGTGICLVPEHNPLVLAKTVSTVDRLSGVVSFSVSVWGGWPRSSLRLAFHLSGAVREQGNTRLRRKSSRSRNADCEREATFRRDAVGIALYRPHHA